MTRKPTSCRSVLPWSLLVPHIRSPLTYSRGEFRGRSHRQLKVGNSVFALTPFAGGHAWFAFRREISLRTRVARVIVKECTAPRDQQYSHARTHRPVNGGPTVWDLQNLRFIRLLQSTLGRRVALQGALLVSSPCIGATRYFFSPFNFAPSLH